MTASDPQALLATLTEDAQRVGERGAALIEGLGEDDAARGALEVLAEAHLTKWCVAKAHGGADTEGLSAADEPSVRALCALRSALAYHSGMLDVMLVMQGLGSYPVAAGARREGTTSSLAVETLEDVIAGRSVAAFALTEPGAGSDLDRIETRAARRGESWRVEGHKTFISNAGLADFYSVLARTEGTPGDGVSGSHTMFLVPATADGVRVHRFEVMAPHPIGDVHFDEVEVGDEHRLGPVGDGLEIALGTLMRFRSSVAAAANGFARRALDESLRHLSSREQFGRPLGTFQGLRFDVAEMDARLRAAELLTLEAAQAVDQPELGANVPASVARAKLFATETASWVCDRAVQHLGGLGVKRGSTVERLFRETRALRIYEGTSEVQKLVLARELLR